MGASYQIYVLFYDANDKLIKIITIATSGFYCTKGATFDLSNCAYIKVRGCGDGCDAKCDDDDEECEIESYWDRCGSVEKI